MKTETIIEIQSETKDCLVWLSLDEKSGNIVAYEDATEDQKETAAEVIGVSVETLQYVAETFNELRWAVNRDLDSIWKRLDRIKEGK